MYTGTIIDDLMATVERAESSLRLDLEQESKPDYRYAALQSGLANASYELAGVA